MQFNSVDFMIFFPAVVAVYFVIPRKLREYWLLIASYYFYMGWNAKYALLIGSSTAITYVSGLLLDRADHTKEERAGKLQKKLVLAACMAVNLGILAVFKYGNFAINSVNYILSKIHVSAAGLIFFFRSESPFTRFRHWDTSWTYTGMTWKWRKIRSGMRCLCPFSLSSWQDRSRDQKTY